MINTLDFADLKLVTWCLLGIILEQINGYWVLLQLSEDLYHMRLPLQMAVFFVGILTNYVKKLLKLH